MSQSLGETARNALGSLKRGFNALLGKGSGPEPQVASEVPAGPGPTPGDWAEAPSAGAATSGIASSEACASIVSA